MKPKTKTKVDKFYDAVHRLLKAANVCNAMDKELLDIAYLLQVHVPSEKHLARLSLKCKVPPSPLSPTTQTTRTSTYYLDGSRWTVRKSSKKPRRRRR